MDTIFAQATAPGKAGVSVIRISGAGAVGAAAGLGADVAPLDRRVCRLIGANGTPLDEAFVLSFPEGHSFTGEPVVELQLHGSPAIVRSVTMELLDQGLRLAEPGEFTRRAMENGRLDLAQVEGLADLIDAETEEQRKQALRVFDGALGDLVEGWRQKLIRAAALLEATIDFVDEEVPINVFPEVVGLLEAVSSELSREANGVATRERIRDGFEVAIVGPPNIGKSTLLNRLAGREAAITSEIAGTTRDVIEVRMDIAGLPVTLLDTAGLRESTDIVEEIGIRRGMDRAALADIRVHLCVDHAEMKQEPSRADIYLLGKADLQANDAVNSVSGVTGDGIDWLLAEISERLEERLAPAGTATRERHATALREGAVLIEEVVSQLERGDDVLVDLLAEDLRTAIRSLDSLVGRIDVESLLGEIFSSFCIGK